MINPRTEAIRQQAELVARLQAERRDQSYSPPRTYGSPQNREQELAVHLRAINQRYFPDDHTEDDNLVQRIRDLQEQLGLSDEDIEEMQDRINVGSGLSQLDIQHFDSVPEEQAEIPVAHTPDTLVEMARMVSGIGQSLRAGVEGINRVLSPLERVRDFDNIVHVPIVNPPREQIENHDIPVWNQEGNDIMVQGEYTPDPLRRGAMSLGNITPAELNLRRTEQERIHGYPVGSYFFNTIDHFFYVCEGIVNSEEKWTRVTNRNIDVIHDHR